MPAASTTTSICGCGAACQRRHRVAVRPIRQQRALNRRRPSSAEAGSAYVLRVKRVAGDGRR